MVPGEGSGVHHQCSRSCASTAYPPSYSYAAQQKPAQKNEKVGIIIKYLLIDSDVDIN